MNSQCYLLSVEQHLTHGTEEVSLQWLVQGVGELAHFSAILHQEVADVDLPSADVG